MNFGLRHDQIDSMHSVFRRHPGVDEVVIYGSRAMGRHREGSDIDLVLKGNELTFQDMLRISGQLDDLLLPWNIDLSLYRSLRNDDLLDHIGRVGQVFYRRLEPDGSVAGL